jgi:DNA-directed RNA polymerase subunit RPC12/RpoP
MTAKKLIIKAETLPKTHIKIKKGSLPQEAESEPASGVDAYASAGPAQKRPTKKMHKAAKPSAPADQDMNARKEFTFLCCSCGKKLSAPVSAEGSDVECPNCKNQITIPRPAPSEGDSDMGYQKPEIFKFFCIRCGQSLEVKRQMTGSDVECPRCRSRITVPTPPDEQTKTANSAQ